MRAARCFRGPIFPTPTIRTGSGLNKSFSSLDVYTGMGYLLQTPSGTEPVPAARVSDGFFSTLGVKPMLGRGFLAGRRSAGEARRS